MKDKAFTLVELIAVLVILAIISLILTPVVLNTVKKAKDSANKRSVDAYGRSIELAIYTYILENKKDPKGIDDLEIEYTGNKVSCEESIINQDNTIYLSKCLIGNKYVEDKSTADGYYHYGNLVINYNIGDQVTYNNTDYYILRTYENSNLISLLKKEPLTVDEVNQYGTGYINKNTENNPGVVEEENGYGNVVFYSSDTCNVNDFSNCKSSYEDSDVKHIVDAWANDNLNSADLMKDNFGYKVRLLNYDELIANFGYVRQIDTQIANMTSDITPDFLYSSNYRSLTMSSYDDSTSEIWLLDYDGDMGGANSYNDSGTIRPVININRKVLK